VVNNHDVEGLRLALARGEVPADFENKLRRLEKGELMHRFIARQSRTFLALLMADGNGSYHQLQPTTRERLLRVLAYVRKDEDAIPDYRRGGFVDDQEEVRLAMAEFAPDIQQFKEWHLCHEVPARWNY
jgi:hypothetical protein